MSSRHAFLISAAHKSSGKTTVSIGLAAALARRGHAVQTFKKGPDYIDPMWHAEAAGRPSRNLDLHLEGTAGVLATWRRHGDAAEVCLVEGNKGLYDGLALDGSDSNAALASTIDVPVVLVIDCRGMTRGIAPLVLGYQAFDPKVRIAGIILNRVGGPRHEGKLRDVLAHYTTLPVLGAIPETPELAILERHLGLMPTNEATDAADRIATLARIVEAHVDLDRLLELTERAPVPSRNGESVLSLCAHRERRSRRARRSAGTTPLRVGIARDRAFGFYYPDDLEALEAAGATLVPFDTLRDARLPDVDALFIGGGFPETLAASLESNASLRQDIRRAIEAGLPTYAECGGLMYLSRGITWNDRRHEMVGVIPAETVMGARPVGRGYVEIEASADHPWWPAGTRMKAHEFHYSRLEGLPADARFGWAVRRGAGIAKGLDGFRAYNLFASYAHLRGLPGLDWAAGFVGFARDVGRAGSNRLQAAAL